MNRLVIADIKSPNYKGKSTGHFFAVARNYRELFKDVVDTVVAGGPVYKAQFNKELLQLPYDVLTYGESKLKNKWKYFHNAKLLFRNTVGDTIVIQQGGVITSFIAIALFYHRQSKLFLIQYSKEGFRYTIGKMLYKLCKNKIDGVICPNDMVGKAFGVPYCVVPDYIYVGNQKKASLTYEEKKYDTCFIGRIEKEKGVLDAAKKIAGTKFRMVIAGKIEDKVLEKELVAVCSSASNIELHIGYLSDEEYRNYINNSRFCFLNYQGEYSKRSSGVVLDTLFNDVPVIGLQCKALEFIGEKGMGFLYDDLQTVDLEKVITKGNYEKYLRNIKFYKETHAEYKEKLGSFLGLK